jgi:hypothetical protein
MDIFLNQSMTPRPLDHEGFALTAVNTLQLKHLHLFGDLEIHEFYAVFACTKEANGASQPSGMALIQTPQILSAATFFCVDQSTIR